MKNWFATNWIKLGLITGFLIFACSFGYSIAFEPQPNPLALSSASSTAEAISGQLAGTVNLQDLVDSLATSNLAYLTIALVILGFLAGAFYLFNFKPLEDQLKKHEDNLTQKESELIELKKEISSTTSNYEADKVKFNAEIEALKKLIVSELGTNKIDVNASVKKIEDKINQQLWLLNSRTKMQMIMKWYSDQYTWEVQKVPDNIISALQNALLEEIEYRREFKTDFLADQILDDVSRHIDKYKDELSENTLKEFLETLGKVQGLEKEKTALAEKINKILREKDKPTFSRLPSL